MQLFMILFFIMFFAIFGMTMIQFARAIMQENRNNHAPRLTVEATVLAKRMNVSRRHSNSQISRTTFTTYYVTFQVESGDRMELLVPGNEYGLMVEGDHGKVTFQGTRFLAFTRT